MTERTIGPDGIDEPVRRSYKFASERMQISREWHNITGTDIPDRIEILPIAEQRAALEFQRRKYQPVTETSGNDDSLLDSDNHNNLT